MTEVTTPRPSLLPRNLVGLKVVVVDDHELVQAGCPDVVLSDIAMVGRDGYWLVRAIRGLADQTARLVPVVATTAYGREHSRERTLAAGFSERLPKPVDPEVLCQTIARMARR